MQRPISLSAVALCAIIGLAAHTQSLRAVHFVLTRVSCIAMTLRHPTPNVKRLGFFGLILLAAILVGSVAYVLLTDDPMLAVEDAFPTQVTPDFSKRPDIVFPESVRSYDLSLNRFVDRFARVCMQAKYSDFRLLLSQRAGDPLLPSRFESMFNALKQVRIVALDELPPLPGTEGSVYIMTAQYDLEDYAQKPGRQTEQIRLAIAKEEGTWRIGPISSEAVEQLEAFERRMAQGDQARPQEDQAGPQDDQAHPQGDEQTLSSAEDTPTEPSLSTNRPARISD